MNQSELESLVTRLLDTKSITAKEAVELLKLNQPKIEYRYIDRPVYYRDWTSPYSWVTSNSNTIASTNIN